MLLEGVDSASVVILYLRIQSSGCGATHQDLGAAWANTICPGHQRDVEQELGEPIAAALKCDCAPLSLVP